MSNWHRWFNGQKAQQWSSRPGTDECSGNPSTSVRQNPDGQPQVAIKLSSLSGERPVTLLFDPDEPHGWRRISWLRVSGMAVLGLLFIAVIVMAAVELYVGPMQSDTAARSDDDRRAVVRPSLDEGLNASPVAPAKEAAGSDARSELPAFPENPQAMESAEQSENAMAGGKVLGGKPGDGPDVMIQPISPEPLPAQRQGDTLPNGPCSPAVEALGLCDARLTN
jgi:hypothetical protein